MRHLALQLLIIVLAIGIGGGVVFLARAEGRAAMSADAIHNHIADIVLRAASLDPMAHANAVADALTPHLLAFRELVEAAEAAGWDHENADLLNRARDACAALIGEPQ